MPSGRMLALVRTDGNEDELLGPPLGPWHVRPYGHLARYDRRERAALTSSQTGVWTSIQRRGKNGRVWQTRTGVRALRELTRRRQESARHLDKVEELNRELDAFAGRVAHDLRNFMSPVAMAPSLLLRATDSPDKIGAIADTIQRANDRSVAMLDGLLAFSRSGRPDPRESCAVVAAVDAVLGSLAPLSARVDARIEKDIEDVAVACSEPLMNVVLMNLVGNALKFLDQSERRIVQVGCKAADDRCEITISDTGLGIPEEAANRIFDPFYRVPGTTAPGVGLGLATVRRIVDAHGGRVTVEKAPGGGATFRVTLPLAHAEPGVPPL